MQFKLSFNHINKNNLWINPNGSCMRPLFWVDLYKDLPEEIDTNDLEVNTFKVPDSMFLQLKPSVFSCYLCSGICNGNESVFNHIRDHINYMLRKTNLGDVMNFDDVPFKENVKVMLISQGFFQCQSCMKIFDDLQKLSSHMLDHQDIKNDNISDTDESIEEVYDSNDSWSDVGYFKNSDTDSPESDSCIIFFPNRFYPTIETTKQTYIQLKDIALNKRVNVLEVSSLKCKICDQQFNEIH